MAENNSDVDSDVDSDEEEEGFKDQFVEKEFKRVTDLIQGSKCPGDFSCSGWSTLITLNCVLLSTRHELL